MSKGLMSYPESERARVAARRLTNRNRGNSFWGAKDCYEKTGAEMPSHVSFDLAVPVADRSVLQDGTEIKVSDATRAEWAAADKVLRGHIKPISQYALANQNTPKRPYKKPAFQNKPRIIKR